MLVVADLVTGVVFTMKAVSPDDDSVESKKFICRGYKYRRLLGLDEIQDREGKQVRYRGKETTGENHVFPFPDIGTVV